MEECIMRYRIDKRYVRSEEGGLRKGWVVQMWDETQWVDVTRVYRTEGEVNRVKETLES